ncbi:hypothetical protein Hanom_Chr05g00398531 [Helianthus anomalus]
MWGDNQTFFLSHSRKHLVNLFSCRRLQMWSADCRPFASEKINTTKEFIKSSGEMSFFFSN